MTEASGRLAASYFTDLFEVGVGGGVYAFLPFLVTAIAIGVVLAAVVFTILRAREATFLRRLTEAGADSAEAGKTLAELGYAPGALRTRLLMRMLKSPTCFLYRNASSDELDRVKAAFSARQVEADNAAGETAIEKSAAADEAADRTAAVGDAATETVTAEAAANGEVSAATAPSAPEGTENAASAERSTDADARRAAREEARRQRQLGLRVAVTDATRFYIPAEQRAYVDSHAGRFSADDIMGLVYTTAAAVLFWFILLNVLEPLLKLLTK